jgi:hypothetical protein
MRFDPMCYVTPMIYDRVQRLDGNEDAAMFNFRPGRTETFGYSENFVY